MIDTIVLMSHTAQHMRILALLADHLWICKVLNSCSLLLSFQGHIKVFVSRSQPRAPYLPLPFLVSTSCNLATARVTKGQLIQLCPLCSAPHGSSLLEYLMIVGLLESRSMTPRLHSTSTTAHRMLCVTGQSSKKVFPFRCPSVEAGH